MKIKDVADYHLEQAKEANSCNEREQEQYHLEMLSALLEEMGKWWTIVYGSMMMEQLLVTITQVCICDQLFKQNQK